MTKKELIYEGKAKTLFFYDDNTIIQYFKDDATAFNKKKHEIINEKGILNNFISELKAHTSIDYLKLWIVHFNSFDLTLERTPWVNSIDF